MATKPESTKATDVIEMEHSCLFLGMLDNGNRLPYIGDMMSEGTMQASERIKEIEIAFCDVPESTSLSKLSEHDWQILQSRWCRGIDWVVGKIGRKWEIKPAAFSGFGLFRTKTAAYQACTDLILLEAKIRKRTRLLAEIQ